MLNHNEFLPRLAAYHDGQLGASDAQEVEAHLRDCSFCQRKLDDWRALDLAILDLPEPETATSDALDRALEEIQSRGLRVSRPDARNVPIRRNRWVLAAAAVLVLAGGVLLLLQMQERAPSIEDHPVVRPENEPPARAGVEADSASGGLGTALPVDSTREPAPAGSPSPGDRVESAPALAQDQDGISGRTRRDSVGQPGTGEGELAQIEPTVTAPVGAGDTGIPRTADWPARLFDTLKVDVHYRLPTPRPPRLVELNLLREFDIEFVGIGYAIGDLLNQGHDARLIEPTMLEPDEAYLVSNLRMERTALLARVSNQVLSAEVALRLAEVTWRLANITADYDDVKHAMVAQADAMQRHPELASRSRARMVRLQAMID